MKTSDDIAAAPAAGRELETAPSINPILVLATAAIGPLVRLFRREG